MTEKNQGWKQKAKNALGWGDRNYNPTAQALNQTGTAVVEFERVGSRIYSEEEFGIEFAKEPRKNSTAIDAFNFYVNQWRKIWNMYKANHVAWGRAGDNPAYGKMFCAVDGIHAEVEVAIIDNRALLNQYEKYIQKAKEAKDENSEEKLLLQQQQLVTEFHIAYLVLAGYQYIKMTINLCWFGKDINTPITTVIQTMQPIQPSYPQSSIDHPKEFGAEPHPQQNWPRAKYTRPVTDEATPKGEDGN